MQGSSSKTERPCEALLQLGAEFLTALYRIGGRLGCVGASWHGAALGIPPLAVGNSNAISGQRQVGSFTGAVAS